MVSDEPLDTSRGGKPVLNYPLGPHQRCCGRPDLVGVAEQNVARA